MTKRVGDVDLIDPSRYVRILRRQAPRRFYVERLQMPPLAEALRRCARARREALWTGDDDSYRRAVYLLSRTGTCLRCLRGATWPWAELGGDRRAMLMYTAVRMPADARTPATADALSDLAHDGRRRANCSSSTTTRLIVSARRSISRRAHRGRAGRRTGTGRP